jgi:hypothetical protein
MAAQVESVVTTFNVSHLDFDIESNEQYNNADLALTAQALSQVRSWASGSGRQLEITYTIPVLPTGLASTGETVLTRALSNGCSCAPAWISNTAYVAGNEVSYNGDNWIANQWNYDEVPGGVNGAWNSDGAC